jgi:hypothetical protein
MTLASAVSAAFGTVAHLFGEGALEGLTFDVLLSCGATVIIQQIAWK